MSERITALKTKLQTFNVGVKKFGKETISNLSASAPVGVHSPNEKLRGERLKESLRVKFRQETTPWGKQIYNIRFGFARHGVSLHYGAGRGYGGQKGSHWRDKDGNLRKTNPQSLGKMGSGNRRPKNWFNPEVKEQLKELDKVVEEYGEELVLNSVRLTLPENE